MHVLRHTPSARFDVIRPAGFRILTALGLVVDLCRVDLVITCGTDSHALPDPHVTGEAYDVSVKGLSAQQIADVKAELDKILGPLFTVLFETNKTPSDPTLRPIAYINQNATGPHFHIQKRKGLGEYPPPEVIGPPVKA